MIQHKLLSAILGLTLLLSACTPSGGAATQVNDATASHVITTADTIDSTTPHDVSTADSMMESPAWFGATLINAHTSQTFTINDFKGKVVLVETMAMWCSNCLRQQGQVKALHELLGERDDFVSIGLDVDPFEDAASLKGYAESNGFGWLYAVSPEDVSREIASLYGDQFLNPSSTPMLVIDRHGVAHPLPFGVKSAEELLQAIQPYLDEGI